MYDDNSKTFMWMYVLWSIFFRCLPLVALMTLNIYLMIIQQIYDHINDFIRSIVIIEFSISGIALIILGILHGLLIKDIKEDKTFKFEVQNQIYKLE